MVLCVPGTTHRAPGGVRGATAAPATPAIAAASTAAIAIVRARRMTVLGMPGNRRGWPGRLQRATAG